jgi:hypothetical protein
MEATSKAVPNPTAKIPWQLSLRVNRADAQVLDTLDRYTSGDVAALPKDDYYDRFYSEFSKDDIKAVIESERIFRATTLDEWLEIARDFYQDATGTKGRPKLLEDEFVTFLRLAEKYGAHEEFRPEQFLNAVWVLGKDATIDHATFESLPYYLEHGLSWHSYLSKAFGHFRAYRPENDLAGIISFGVEPEQSAEFEPETEPHPNCQARCHMGQFEFAIHNYAMGLSRKSGECWLSRDTTAKWTNTHPQTAKKKIDWLVEKGWLVIVKAPRAGRGGQGTYRVVDHDEWVSQHGASSCLRKPVSQ